MNGGHLDGVDRIAMERYRQVAQEGYTAEHDAGHKEQLAWAAACYAAPEPIFHVRESHVTEPDGILVNRMVWHEPWPRNWRRSTTTRLRQLEKAGALIAAEIDRLLAEEVT